MSSYTEPFKMDTLWLMMEYKRLVILESQGEIDESVPYDAKMLERQIMNRLNEYDVDRY